MPDHRPTQDERQAADAGRMADHMRSPTSQGTEDPDARRLGEPRPDEPPAAFDPNNPNPAPDMADAIPPHGDHEKKLERLLKGKSGDAVLARYLENHGRWQNVTTRTHAGTRNSRAFVFCDCAVCREARHELKLED